MRASDGVGANSQRAVDERRPLGRDPSQPQMDPFHSQVAASSQRFPIAQSRAPQHLRQPPMLSSAAAHAQSSTQVLVVVSRQKQLQPTGFHSFCRDGSVSCSSPVQPRWTGTPGQVHHAGSNLQHGRCQPPTMWEAVSLPRFRAAAASLQFPFLGAASLNSRSHPYLPTSASLTTRSGPYCPKHATPGASRSFSGLVAGYSSHSGSTLLRQARSLHDGAQD